MVPNFQGNMYNWTEKFILSYSERVLYLLPVTQAAQAPGPDSQREWKICMPQHPTFSNRKGQAECLLSLALVT